jgi:hypothetical protein
MDNRLSNAFQDTHFIVELTNGLKDKTVQCETDKIVVDAFLKLFTLSDSDVKVLSSTSEPIDMHFFNALQNIQQIHKNCKALLVADNQKVGLEIMDLMITYQEAAYERLFKWTQYECRAMKNESPEISTEFRQAMHALRLRPILFE